MFQFNILFDHRRRRRGDKREDKPPAISNLSLAPLKNIPERGRAGKTPVIKSRSVSYQVMGSKGFRARSSRIARHTAALKFITNYIGCKNELFVDGAKGKSWKTEINLVRRSRPA